MLIAYSSSRCHDPRKLLSGQEHGYRYRMYHVASLLHVYTDYLAQKPALYLHVTSTSKEGLDKAVQLIDDLMQKELPNLVDERRFKPRPQEQFERDEYGRVCDCLILYLPKMID